MANNPSSLFLKFTAVYWIIYMVSALTAIILTWDCLFTTHTCYEAGMMLRNFSSSEALFTDGIFQKIAVDVFSYGIATIGAYLAVAKWKVDAKFMLAFMTIPVIIQVGDALNDILLVIHF